MPRRDYIEIGSTPPDEICASVGEDGYAERARAECCRYISTLRRFLGPEPEGAELAIKSFEHDFGRYYEVVCYYVEDNEKAMEYAFKCEGEGPLTWDAKPTAAAC
jgi:hypothetical protein